MTDIDKVAEAIWYVDPRSSENEEEWATLETRWRTAYIRMAEAAVEAMNLTPERGIHARSGVGELPMLVTEPPHGTHVRWVSAWEPVQPE